MAALAVAACVVGAIAWCGPPRQLRAREVALQVELDAFSGLPNPRWNLTEEQTAGFLTRFRALRTARDVPSTGGGLGYRGFVVRPNTGTVNGYDEIRLYHGTVRARRGDRVETFSDSDRGLERWLLDSARGHVDESILKYIRDEIGR